MLLRSADALKASRTVARRPNLNRFFVKGAKPTEDIRPWPTGPAGKFQKVPEKSHCQPRADEPPVPVSLYRIPNNSPAYIRWPTLRLFQPTLWPRPSGVIRPGGKGTILPGKQAMCLPYLYHDLGVMIFEGADKNQVTVMGDVIDKVVGHAPRLQLQDWTLPTNDRKKFRKWSVYRMPVDQKVPPGMNDRINGPVLALRLHRLCEEAIKRWKDDWVATMKAEGLPGNLPIEVINSSRQIFLMKHQSGHGVTNYTINGPRHSQVDAYVATGTHQDTILMDVELHTVGTKRFLGSFSLRFRKARSEPDTTDGKLSDIVNSEGNAETEKPRTPGNERRGKANPKDMAEIRKLYADYAPNSITRDRTAASEAMLMLFKLERKLWMQRLKMIYKDRQEKKAVKKAEWKAAKKSEKEAAKKLEKEAAKKSKKDARKAEKKTDEQKTDERKTDEKKEQGNVEAAQES